MEEIQKQFVISLKEMGMSSEEAFNTSVTFFLSYVKSKGEENISDEEYSGLVEEFLERLSKVN